MPEMSRQQLRVELDWFCGCGLPREAAGALLRLLRLHPLYDHRDDFKAFVPDDGIEFLLLYMLDHFALTEHGGTVGGAWLTEKGKAVRDALAREEGDEFEELSESCCIHGYAVENDELDDHDCMKAPEPVKWNREGPPAAKGDSTSASARRSFRPHFQ